MANARFFDRAKRENAQAAQGQATLEFSAAGVATTGVAFNAISDANRAVLLNQFPEIYELGRLGVRRHVGVAGNATTNIAVPTGKFWRVLAFQHRLVTDATVATRALNFALRNAADTPYQTITQANQTASQTVNQVSSVGPNANAVGNQQVAARGTLSMATNPSNNETITIDGVVYTFVTTDNGSVTNAIQIGANAAATQALVTPKINVHPTVKVATDWAGNNLVVEARQAGTAGNSIATTETLAAGGNQWDAATLGTTQAGVDAAIRNGTIDFPAPGGLLVAAEDINVTVTNGVAGDVLDFYVFYLEFDVNPA